MSGEAHVPLTSVAVAPRPHSTDRPGEHNPEKGVQHDSLLDGYIQETGDSSTTAAAAAAEPRKPAGDAAVPSNKQEALAGVSDDLDAAAARNRGASDYAAPDEDDSEGPSNLDELVDALSHRLALGDDKAQQLLQSLQPESVLDSLDLKGVASLITSGKARRIIVMCGAGVSVSAGIPDFRTPGTGLYSQLERFGLPEPEAVFSIGFFRKNPKPFHMLAKELFPGNYQPTPAHYFMKLLHDKGLLLRCFTQNIDSLEHQAGLPQTAVVAAHGNFDSAHCISCNKEHSLEYVKEAVFSDKICHCTKCGSYVKPDIVFFGEQLPERFYDRMMDDFPLCDLLLVMGTSLVVQPFASLIDRVPDQCPRVLINRERVGEGSRSLGVLEQLLGLSSGGFVFEGSEGAYRDVLCLGNADDATMELAELLGWGQDLEALISANGSGTAESASSSVPAATSSSSSSSAATGTAASTQQSARDSGAAGQVDAAGTGTGNSASGAASSEQGGDGSSTGGSEPQPRSKV